MLTIDELQAGVTQINQKFFESPELSIENYRALIAEYLIDRLLAELGYEIDEHTKGFSFYEENRGSYTGYITMGDDTLFFAPTTTIILKPDSENGFDWS